MDFFFRTLFFSTFAFCSSISLASQKLKTFEKDVTDFSISKGVNLERGYFDSFDQKNIKNIGIVSADKRREIRKFIDEKINNIQLHEFFSINRFNGPVPPEKDQELIDNWKGWYIGKHLVSILGGKNAQKELSLILESKKEFYETIEFMTTDPQVGLKAKEFYKKQLEAVNQLLPDK